MVTERALKSVPGLSASENTIDVLEFISGALDMGEVSPGPVREVEGVKGYGRSSFITVTGRVL